MTLDHRHVATEQEARSRYRIVSEPSWRLEFFHIPADGGRIDGVAHGQWVVSCYCTSCETAWKAMERRVKKMVDGWSGLECLRTESEIKQEVTP